MHRCKKSIDIKHEFLIRNSRKYFDTQNLDLFIELMDIGIELHKVNQSLNIVDKKKVSNNLSQRQTFETELKKHSKFQNQKRKMR